MMYKVIGRMYSEQADYANWDHNKEFPTYDRIEGTERTWHINAESLDDAEQWLIENYPERYMGANIIGNNGDFKMLCVPCIEYGKGNYETHERRIKFVQSIR